MRGKGTSSLLVCESKGGKRLFWVLSGQAAPLVMDGAGDPLLVIGESEGANSRPGQF